MIDCGLNSFIIFIICLNLLKRSDLFLFNFFICIIYGSVLIEGVMDQQFESRWTLNNFVVEHRISRCPSPGGKQLTPSFHNLLSIAGTWQRIAWTALDCAWTLLVPLSTNRWLCLAQYSIRLSTNIGGRILEVIIARDGEIKMSHTSFTSVGPWRASVLLHHNCRPVLIDRTWVGNKQTFTTSTNIINSTTTIIRSKHRRECITGSTCHPQFLPIFGTTMVDWIKWGIHASISVFVLVPRLQSFGIAGPAIAVPEMGRSQCAVSDDYWC